jgi:hypothetical protein
VGPGECRHLAILFLTTPLRQLFAFYTMGFYRATLVLPML